MTNGAQQPQPADIPPRINANGDLEYVDKDGNWKLYTDPVLPISGEDHAAYWIEKGAAPDDADGE